MTRPLSFVVIGLGLLAAPAFAQVHPTAPPVKPQTPGTQNASGQTIPTVAKPPNQNLSSLGMVFGMISWDTTKIHAAPQACQKLQVNAVKGTQLAPNPPSGQTHLLPYQLQGNVAQCPFEIDGVPLGVGLTVHYRVDSNAFTPAVAAMGQSGQFEIPGGTCGGLKGQPRTTSDGIVVCGNTAKSVNFPLVAISSLPQPMSGSSGQSKFEKLSASSRAVAGMAGPGTISGVIWWDTKTVQTAPAPVGDVCNATGVTIAIHQTVRGQPLQSWVQVGSTPHWSSLMGGGNQDMKILEFGSVVACLFKITGLPVKTDLTVLINPSKEIFLPKGGGNLPRGVGNVSTVNIPGGSCAAPPPQPTAIAQFTGPVSYCGNGAYNVNFALQPTTL